jgi:hypothetical protein
VVTSSVTRGDVVETIDATGTLQAVTSARSVFMMRAPVGEVGISDGTLTGSGKSTFMHLLGCTSTPIEALRYE